MVAFHKNRNAMPYNEYKEEESDCAKPGMLCTIMEKETERKDRKQIGIIRNGRTVEERNVINSGPMGLHNLKVLPTHLKVLRGSCRRPTTGC